MAEGGGILPFLVLDDDSADTETMGGLFHRGEATIALREIPAAVLKASLKRTISMLNSVLSEVADESPGMRLQEVQIGIEVSASGGIALIGTAQAGTTGAITLVFHRD